MSLLNQKPLSQQEFVKPVKRKVKYIIIASDAGIVYGAFNPDDECRAQEYLEKVRGKESHTTIKLHRVSNLNLFLSTIKNARQAARNNT